MTTDAEKVIVLLKVATSGLDPDGGHHDLATVLYLLLDWDAPRVRHALNEAVDRGWANPPPGFVRTPTG